jgi:hypothetical protein
MKSVYKIKKGLKTPMIIAALLSIPVFADLLINRTLQTSMLVLALLLMMVFYLLTINNLLRRVIITDTEVRIRGLGGKRHLPIEDISFIDGVIMGSKQFVTITSNKKHYFIPNSFDNFSGVLSDLEAVVKEDAVGEGFKALKENVVPRRSDITGAWITVIVLIIVIFVIFYQR